MGVGLMICLLIPFDAFAAQVKDVYGARKILEIGSNLKTFMFETAVPYTAGIFGGVNVIRSLSTNNYQALGGYGLLTASAFVVPPFLEGIFGSSMLIP
jgi:hypothetical protein